MQTYSLSHLADRLLLHDLKAIVSRDCSTTAEMLAHIAEVDERRLFLPAAHPSMHAYCVHELHMSEDQAFKRIQAARAAREFPAIFTAVANGRVHLSAVVLLAPHLTQETAESLLAAAAHKTKAEVALLLAQRFPRPDVPATIRPVETRGVGTQLVPEPVALDSLGLEPVDAPPVQHAPGHVARSTVAPLSPRHFGVEFTFGQRAYDKLRYAQSLLSHVVPTGDIAEVLERGLDQLIEHVEKRKFAASTRTRPRRGAPKGRHVPAEVRRTVSQRDGGQCTFHSDVGKRCPAVSRLEFDHIEPVARGGESTATNLRLRCRAHNQYAAEQTFGAGFMKRKREEARGRTAQARAQVEATTRAEAETRAKTEAAAARARHDEVIPWLRSLGFRPEEAKRGAAMCEGMADASLEARVQCALSGLGRARFQRSTQVVTPAGAAP